MGNHGKSWKITEIIEITEIIVDFWKSQESEISHTIFGSELPLGFIVHLDRISTFLYSLSLTPIQLPIDKRPGIGISKNYVKGKRKI